VSGSIVNNRRVRQAQECFATDRQSAQNEKIGSQQPLIGLLADGTWVPMAAVHFAAVTAALLAAWMAVRAKS
jgi:hypothetical protein